MKVLTAWRLGVVGGLVLVMSLLFLSGVQAQQQPQQQWKFRGGEEIVVPAGETIADDLYAAGNRIRIEGQVEGDLFAAGQDVTITGSVLGDVFAAGNRVTISGPVGGDLRATAATLVVSNTVGEDVLAGAGNLTVEFGARIGQDLVFGTGETVLQGSVGGNVLGQTGRYTNVGTVPGEESVTIEAQPAEAAPPTVLDRVLDEVRRYLGILLFGALLLWLAPRVAKLAATVVRERPLPSFGFGLLAVAGTVAALFVLLIAAIILAIPLGMLGFGGLVATIIVGALLVAGALAFALVLASTFLASAVVGLAIGRFLMNQLNRGTAAEAERPWAALLLGVLIVVLLTAIPVVGGVLNLIVALLGLGALVLLAYDAWRGRRATALGQEVAPGGVE